LAIYVVNEWFWADLDGGNGKAAQLETFDFLNIFARSDAQMLVVIGSAFDQKAWSLCRSHSSVIAGIGKAFFNQIRINSDRCRLLQPDEIADFPKALLTQVKPDDRYLVQACATVPSAILVTTDAPLAKAVREYGISCLTRAEIITAASKESL
jgi:hypothetical protein